MNKNTRKWIEALRSGKYKQTTNYLHSKDGYCCLGVACEIYPGDLHVTQLDEGDLPIYAYDEYTISLPDSVREWLGLSDSDGYYGYGYSLSEDNDDGKTFQEIADIIESEPTELFINEEVTQ